MPLRSLLRPFYEWHPKKKEYVLTHHTFTGVDHMDTMNYRPFFRVLTDIMGDHVERTASEVAAAQQVMPDWWKNKKKRSWDMIENALNNMEDSIGLWDR